MDRDQEGRGCAAIRAAIETAWIERHCQPAQVNKPGKEAQERNPQTKATTKRRRPKRDTKLSDWFTPQEQSVNEEDRDGLHGIHEGQETEDAEIPVTRGPSVESACWENFAIGQEEGLHFQTFEQEIWKHMHIRLRTDEREHGHEIMTARGQRWRWRAVNTGQRVDSQSQSRCRQPGVVVSQNLKGAGITLMMQTITTMLTHIDPDVLLPYYRKQT